MGALPPSFNFLETEMTYKFVAVKEKELSLSVPIYGEEPVQVQFHLGFFETDEDYIGMSMRHHKYYGDEFYEFGDMPVEKPVKKVTPKVVPIKKVSKPKVVSKQKTYKRKTK
jgi:hypothetical protein